MTQPKTLESVSREDIENAFRLYDEGTRPKGGDGSKPGIKQYVHNPSNPDVHYPVKMLFRLICLAEVGTGLEEDALDLYLTKMGLYEDMKMKLKELDFKVISFE